jgi:glyoxylase-like metal-dependent hydrolase (beta-lactamase superfamily II)
VLITHGHHDHVGGLGTLPPGVEVYAHPELSRRIPGSRPLENGERVAGLDVMYAPGHSLDMLAFLGDGLAFVGDTIFAGSLGRADSARNYPVLLETARRILAAPDDTVLYCGHGPVTSVAWEREHNAFPVA